jgi:hypothetical protein
MGGTETRENKRPPNAGGIGTLPASERIARADPCDDAKYSELRRDKSLGPPRLMRLLWVICRAWPTSAALATRRRNLNGHKHDLHVAARFMEHDGDRTALGRDSGTLGRCRP